MRKIAEKLLNEKKISQEEFDQVKDMTKEAFLPELKNVMSMVGLAALTGTLGAELYRRGSQAYSMSKTYDDMKEKVPTLKEYPEEQIRDYYNVIKTFSPKAASNSLVAGHLVNKMLAFEGVDHKLVQDLALMEGPKKNILEELAVASGKGWAGSVPDEE